MHVHSIKVDELARFATVGTAPENVESIQAYVTRMFEQGAMRPEWCLVAEHEGHWIGRGAAWTLPRVGTPLDLVLFDIDFDDQELARDVLHQYVASFRAMGAAAIGYVLDDPAQAPQWQDAAAARHSLLINSGWTLVRETSRWERSSGADVLLTGRLTYRALSETGEDAFVAVVERISAGALDRRIVAERECYGAVEAARSEFVDLQSMDFQPDWWEIAYTPTGELVGMVMPTGSPTFGTIGYIGVVPEQRGHGYGDELLARGTATLRRADYHRLVCDTDIGNTPMANIFRRAKWAQFATRREYSLPASTNG